MGRSFGIPPERLRLLGERRAPLQHPQQVGEGAAPSASHIAFTQGEKKMVQSDLLTCCCCDRLCRSPAHAFLLLSSSRSSLTAEAVHRKPGGKCAGLEEPRLSLLTCRQQERRLERAGNAQVLIVPLCSHVRLHQESCIRQRTERSEEGQRGARSVIWAQPAPLSSTPPK